MHKYRSTTRHGVDILVLVDVLYMALEGCDTSQPLVQEFQPMVEICTSTAEEQLSEIGACGGCDRADRGMSFFDVEKLTRKGLKLCLLCIRKSSR